ncbi:MAG: hypothetical protein Q4B45_01185 [Coriobacteriia bacterium]|nr:hypothetical protein [Coriobacteriia bacterium]
MSKKFKGVLLFAVLASLVGLVLSVCPTRSMAEEADGRTVTVVVSDLDSSSAVQQVNELLSDPSITTLNVIDASLVARNRVSGDSAINPIWDVPTDLRNLTYLGNVTGSTRIASAKGYPGMNLEISCTKEVSNEYSCSVSLDSHLVSGCVGFDVSDTESVSVSGSADVPYYYNGRRVASMTLNAYTLYENYSYDVYQYNSYVATGYARRASGCTFSRTYSYA